MRILIISKDNIFTEESRRKFSKDENNNIVQTTEISYIYNNCLNFEAIYIDYVLPQINSLELLFNLLSLNDNLNIVMISKKLSDFEEIQATTIGAKFCVEYPIGYDRLLEISKQLIKMNSKLVINEEIIPYIYTNYTDQVDEILKQLNLDEKLLGYDYLKLAILKAIEMTGQINNISQNIYTDVAKVFKTSISCVERNIRTVIGKACKLQAKSKNDDFYQLFAIKVDKYTRPSNKTFISRLAQKIIKDTIK